MEHHDDERPPMRRAAPRRDAARRRTSWVRTGAVLLGGFCLWLVMDAAVLHHNAQVNSPAGTRRTVAMDVLGPLEAFARLVGLDVPAGQANLALGRTAEGGLPPPPTVPTTVPHSTTTTTTLPHAPTHAHPLRVLIVGDSLGEDLAAPLLTDLNNTGATIVWTDTRISTGLTRLDYYNWIAELEYDVYTLKPDVVIGMMGANDPQGFPGPPYVAFNTVPWRAKYLRNVGQFFTIGRSAGRQFLWVSLPQISDPGRNKLEFGVVRALQHQAAVAHGVKYYDSDTVLSPNGHYAAYLRVGGQLALVRQPDGIHLTPAGSALLAQSVFVAMQREFKVHLP